MLERLLPIYETAQTNLYAPLPADPSAKLELAATKSASKAFIETWSPILFPADDDGG